jgi:hypothetical protein
MQTKEVHNIDQNIEILTTQKRKRGRPSKKSNENPISSSDESYDSNCSSVSSENGDNNNKKVGRPRKYATVEEKKEARKILDKIRQKGEKYIKTYTENRKTYMNDAFPLTKLEHINKFQCNICKSLISSARDYKIHEKTKRHQENCNLPEI